VLGRVFQMRRITWTFVSQNAQVVGYDGRVLTLGIATEGLTNTFRSGNHAEIVRQALIDQLGMDVIVEGVHAPDSSPAQPTHHSPPASSFGSSASEGPAPAAEQQTDPAPATPAPPREEAGPPQPGPMPQAAAPPQQTASAAPRSNGEAIADAGLAPAPPRRSLEDNAGWGSVTGPPPDWATGPAAGATAPQQNIAVADAPPAKEPSGQQARKQSAPRGTRSGADAVRASLDAARRAGAPAASGADEVRRPFTDDSAVSDDDEDIEVSTDAGRAVIEKVLGGRVLHEFDE
jgi:DNA polymerase-3 subunit gamma/tau